MIREAELLGDMASRWFVEGAMRGLIVALWTEAQEPEFLKDMEQNGVEPSFACPATPLTTQPYGVALLNAVLRAANAENRGIENVLLDNKVQPNSGNLKTAGFCLMQRALDKGDWLLGEYDFAKTLEEELLNVEPYIPDADLDQFEFPVAKMEKVKIIPDQFLRKFRGKIVPTMAADPLAKIAAKKAIKAKYVAKVKAKQQEAKKLKGGK